MTTLPGRWVRESGSNLGLTPDQEAALADPNSKEALKRLCWRANF